MVEKALQRSMTRMQVDTLDCVQFHWWDYGDKRYLEALGHLSDLQQEGVIRMCAVLLNAQFINERTTYNYNINS